MQEFELGIALPVTVADTFKAKIVTFSEVLESFSVQINK